MVKLIYQLQNTYNVHKSILYIQIFEWCEFMMMYEDDNANQESQDNRLTNHPKAILFQIYMCI